jgi:hypothetical protein
MTFVANVVPHFMEIKHEVVPKHVDLQPLFIDLCDSFGEDRMPSIFLYALTSYLHTSHFALNSMYSQYSIQDIPFVLNVIDYFQAMLFVAHASYELKDFNYDNLCIEFFCCISTIFNGDVLFELPPIVNLVFTLGRCREWTRNMMAMHGARLR